VRDYYKPGLKELLVEWKLESRLNLRAEIQDGRIGNRRNTKRRIYTLPTCNKNRTEPKV
jgi:hypothetical protein